MEAGTQVTAGVANSKLLADRQWAEDSQIAHQVAERGKGGGNRGSKQGWWCLLIFSRRPQSLIFLQRKISTFLVLLK